MKALGIFEADQIPLPRDRPILALAPKDGRRDVGRKPGFGSVLVGQVNAAGRALVTFELVARWVRPAKGRNCRIESRDKTSTIDVRHQAATPYFKGTRLLPGHLVAPKV